MLQSGKLLLKHFNIYKMILHIIVSWRTHDQNFGRDA
jgi:hypothetical protein